MGYRSYFVYRNRSIYQKNYYFKIYLELHVKKIFNNVCKNILKN